ncbi:hypothetical protein HETIRDRAFT_411995 [Heterobasidion irregulare TC 32-1]|uniref:Uncharacterized protein n=1 Tax=Heterobasidion irregulare (strain TC 32-1) TaxID=747525 RepID=W4JUF9_HETIT|nr:uncharacterized protein HETIRDRAFT_411995 [Heterobasidion irregulare TC 32-1]ETW76715.1 hypothetical protein HETIRDRAFT_411995 [Heterobasidion irregulare TC 32-1]
MAWLGVGRCAWCACGARIASYGMHCSARYLGLRDSGTPGGRPSSSSLSALALALALASRRGGLGRAGAPSEAV